MTQSLIRNIFAVLTVAAVVCTPFSAFADDGYIGGGVYNDAFVGSPSYNDGYIGSSAYNDGYVGSPSYNDGYIGYSSPSWTGYSSPSYGYTTYSSYSYPTTYGYTNYTYPTYTAPVVTTPIVAPTTVVPTTTSTVCSDGFAPVNGSCVRTNTIPTTVTTLCSDGQAPINGSCVRTNTLPTAVQTICSDGSYPINGSCVRTQVVPTTTVSYQTCWDGSTIPLGSVCPSQYKTCANGTSIPVYQTCYYGNTYVPYVPPATIKFNNVITSVTTEITNTSARCNGIGLIAANASSVGWFEYGETANLGRETAHANIGSSATSPFSNKLVNLKPSTTYYCRAVMQNQYGTVKGEVVAFTTKAKAVAYVKPVTVTTVKVTPKPVKKNEVLCVDGQVVTVGSQSAAQLINAGQKLISLQIEKVSGNFAPNSQVIYRLTVKNISDQDLKNVTVKVTIPQEIMLTNASAGTYDSMSHVLTIANLPLAAYGTIAITWTGVVVPEATVGNSTVTTAYTSYSVPGSSAVDEVNAYVASSVVPTPDNATTTGAKKVIGVSSSGASFLPNTLVEWLALIAILFIIFILGRSVYTSYRSDKDSH